jgi:hypothetical protein
VFSCCLGLFLAVQELELRALQLLGRCSITWHTPPFLFCLFLDWVSCFCQGLDSDWNSSMTLSSLDHRYAKPPQTCWFTWSPHVLFVLDSHKSSSSQSPPPK